MRSARPIRGFRQDPSERPGDGARERADQREVEHDRRGGFAHGQPARLDRGPRIGERAGDGERAPTVVALAMAISIVAGKMRPQHHQHADEADHDRGPAVDADRSFRMIAASATVINGVANEIAVASTSGSRASAAKLQNMPTTLISPRVTWPSGRPVRSAATSSPRQAKISTTGMIAKASERIPPGRADGVAEIADQGRHHGEQQHREQLEDDAFAGIHRACRHPEVLNVVSQTKWRLPTWTALKLKSA